MTAPDPRVGEIENGHYFDTCGYDVWGYDRAGHYAATHDRRPFQASPFPHCTACDEGTCSVTNGGLKKKSERWADNHAPADVAYLLAELRKAREALGRVEEVAARLHWEADNANEGAKYAAEVNQGASLMALESERFAYQKAEHLIRAAVASAKETE